MKKKIDAPNLLEIFVIPVTVACGILLSLLFTYIIELPAMSTVVLLFVIVLGSYQLITETIQSLLHKQFALDYIALLAITLGVATGNFIVAAIIVLMLSGGNKLEEYAMTKAKGSLTALTDRIPNTVLLADTQKEMKIEQVTVGTRILVRKGEVIPLDGILASESGTADESSLTGEPYMIDKKHGDIVRSGTVNTGEPMIIEVTNEEKDSTYRKIVEMVQQAQSEKSPIIRLANKYSTVFTLITLSIAGLALLFTHDFGRVLAVLVIATPCPLILATPIALMGGMNSAARNKIIIKRLASIEVLARLHTIIFDKTGTITLGKPDITEIVLYDDAFDITTVLSIAAAIERNSLHPLAKAIVEKAKKAHVEHAPVTDIHEEVGKGIQGTFEEKIYLLQRAKSSEGMRVEMLADTRRIATFVFEDQIKKNSASIVHELVGQGISVHIFTGDKRAVADKLVNTLGADIQVQADCTPEDKKNGIAALHKQGKVVAMVGDGINDAPALALADVGMVFSNDEHTAASEAADIIFLGGDFTTVSRVLMIGRKTIRIAQESIMIGIGLSIMGMIFAAFGHIPPVIGAFIQEAIDIFVIVNALRASRIA